MSIQLAMDRFVESGDPVYTNLTCKESCVDNTKVSLRRKSAGTHHTGDKHLKFL
jgi:hypothetical protein